MKEATSIGIFELIGNYVRNTYDDGCITCIHLDTLGDTDNLTEEAREIITEHFHNNYAFIHFEDCDEAIDFCDSIPDSNPYCSVWNSDGEALHENT